MMEIQTAPVQAIPEAAPLSVVDSPVGTASFGPTVLDARDIALSFQKRRQPARPVLTDFSLEVKTGEVVALLGPSGVGKTSLLRVLAGMQSPDRGRVRVHGEPLNGPHPRLSFMFQDACLLPWLTLEGNVGFGLDFKHQPAISKQEKKDRIEAAVAEVGLQAAMGTYPNELSGGMAQRVALARSLARQPELLLLDEPFSALDAITRGEMQALLKEVIARHGTSAVLVTHDIDESLLLADRILLIGDRPGRLMDTWSIDLPHPRDEAAPELVSLRADILRGMRHARRAQTS